MGRIAKYLLLVALVFCAGLWTVIRGQDFPPGTLDPTFGTGGVSTPTLSFATNSLFMRLTTQMVNAGAGEEEMVVAVANVWKIARYRADGTLDTSFGVRPDGTPGGGVVTNIWNGRYATLEGGVVVDSENRLVVAGLAPRAVTTTGKGGKTSVTYVATVAIARYSANGMLDTTFGTAGYALVPIFPDTPLNPSHARDIVVQEDGKIVVLAYAQAADNYQRMSVVRLWPDGTLDPSFGSGGRFTYRYPGDTGSYGWGIALQTVGGTQRIVIAGGSRQGSGETYLETGQVIRLNADGTLDQAFNGGTGVFRTVAPNAWSTTFKDVAIDASNGIIAAGGTVHGSYSENNVTEDMIIARFREDGTLDSGFGHGGTYSERWGGQYDSDLKGIAVQADGDILAVGDTWGGTAIWRFLPTGLPDTAFGTDGWVVRPTSVTLTSLALVNKQDGSNTFVVGGGFRDTQSRRQQTSYAALWRYFY
jgi:uncharacterized delta-60 repeat protein